MLVLLGFMLGVLIRSSTGAIVAYFVYAFVLPPLLELLAANQPWFHDLHPWVDPNVAQQRLFHGPWPANSGSSSPSPPPPGWSSRSLVGLWTLQRSEVK